MLLLELLNKPVRWEWALTGDPETKKAVFTIDNVYYTVYIEQYDEQGTWDIQFSAVVNGEETEEKTGTGHELAVFATVKAIVTDFIQRFQPERIEFSTRKNETTRAKLYSRFVKMLINNGWVLDKQYSGTGKREISWILVRS